MKEYNSLLAQTFYNKSHYQLLVSSSEHPSITFPTRFRNLNLKLEFHLHLNIIINSVESIITRLENCVSTKIKWSSSPSISTNHSSSDWHILLVFFLYCWILYWQGWFPGLRRDYWGIEMKYDLKFEDGNDLNELSK